MRVRTWSACVALAWGILLIVTAAGPIGSLRPAQATTRIASSYQQHQHYKHHHHQAT